MTKQSRTKVGNRWCAPAAMAVLAGTACNALAQTTLTWNNGAGGNWFTSGNWTPAGVPNNSGPTFNAVVEFTGGQQSQARYMEVELPTGTTKRFVMPAFASGRYSYHWSARLLDERRKVRAEQQATQKQREWGIPLAGAMTRAGGGMPTLPESRNKNLSAPLKVARLLPDLFPDNPIALEGLGAIYLNPARALELKFAQDAALRAWLHGGGHLIVGVESVTDVTGNEWLRRLLPCEVNGLSTVANHPELHDWVRSNRRAVER